MFYKIVVLKTFAESTEKHVFSSLIKLKAEALQTPILW